MEWPKIQENIKRLMNRIVQAEFFILLLLLSFLNFPCIETTAQTINLKHDG